MKRFKNILLVHDSGESGQSTLSRAIDLARCNQARLTVIQVIGKIPRDYQMLITSVTSEEIMKLASKEYTLRLEREVAHFPDTSHVTCKILVGREFIEIIKEVLRNKHDLVIKTVRGMGGKLGMLFGSTAMHLLRKCPCPVWLIKPGQAQCFHRIMAAVDVAPMESKETALNTKIMGLASSLSRMDKSELHIVHAWKWVSPDAQLKTLKSPVDIRGQIKKMRIDWLKDLLHQSNLQHLPHQEHIVEGTADEVIPKLVHQHQIDLVVMGTVCRAGIPGFFIGNTAEKILYSLDCSVLAVKPDGFISPVQLDT
ncbi:MAG: universal stress protein [Proteobacteria bacterium]|nr:universal stress protein [Pseudomonadota bacterium]